VWEGEKWRGVYVGSPGHTGQSVISQSRRIIFSSTFCLSISVFVCVYVFWCATRQLRLHQRQARHAIEALQAEAANREQTLQTQERALLTVRDDYQEKLNEVQTSYADQFKAIEERYEGTYSTSPTL
jgi:uncharacterized protein YlxW (UPF0749 family)